MLISFVSIIGSNIINGTCAVASTPYNLVATSDNTKIYLSWDCGDNGHISGFDIFRSTDNITFNWYASVSPNTARAWTDNNPTNNTILYYEVEGYYFISRTDNSPASNVVVSMIPARVPFIPNISTTGGNFAVYVPNVLNWSFNLYCSGGNPLTSIKVYRGDSGSGSEHLIAQYNYYYPYTDYISSYADGHEHGYLMNGYTYYYRIGFVNSIGENTSAEIPITPDYYSIIPDAPSISTDSHGFRWISFYMFQSNNGGFPATSFNITRSIDNSHFTSIYFTDSAGSYTDYTVLNNLTYYYRITQINKIGESAVSNVISDMASGLTTPPLNLTTHITPNQNEIHLTWNYPSDNGGYIINNYKIYRGLTNSSFTLITTSPDLYYTDPSLTYGTTYYYKVTAVTGLGESSFSNMTSGKPVGKPLNPTGATAHMNQNHTKIAISWVSSGDSGSPIIKFNIYRCLDNITFFIYDMCNNSFNYYFDENVDPNQTYYYKITAVNINGESDYSNVCSAFIIPLETTTTPTTTTTTQSSQPVNIVLVFVIVGTVAATVLGIWLNVWLSRRKKFYGY